MAKNLYAVVHASKHMGNADSTWVHGDIERIFSDGDLAKKRIDELAKKEKEFYTEDPDYTIKMEMYMPGNSYTVRVYNSFRNSDIVHRYTVEKAFIWDEP